MDVFVYASMYACIHAWLPVNNIHMCAYVCIVSTGSATIRSKGGKEMEREKRDKRQRRKGGRGRKRKTDNDDREEVQSLQITYRKFWGV